MTEKIIGTMIPLSALSTRSESRPGTFGAGLAFLDWLKNTHQRAWGLLPLSETHLQPGSTSTRVPSPYRGYGVGLDPRYLSSIIETPEPSTVDLEQFRAIHREWIDDHCLFVALRDHFGTDDWTRWETGIRLRHGDTVATMRERLAEAITTELILQWKLHAQFRALRTRAASLGISLVGDLPFYLPLQSPLVWTNQHLFDIVDDGSMPRVSGVPNGPLAHFGRQVWGHPLYRWNKPELVDKMTRLWILRIRYLASCFDIMRLDHAKGFYLYGVIDRDHPEHDGFQEGPGAAFLTALVDAARSANLQMYAEDSGDRTTPLRETLASLGIPGMRIFRFSLTTKGEERYFPQYGDVRRYPERCVAMTTTHDTEPLFAYVAGLTEVQKRKLAAGAGVEFAADDRELTNRFRRAVINSPADMVLIPIQDWLLSTDRINTPGTEIAVDDPNWRFRLEMPVEELPIDVVEFR